MAVAPAPVGVPEADTTPAFTSALKRSAMLFVGGADGDEADAVETEGAAGWTAESRLARSIGSDLVGAPYAIGGAGGGYADWIGYEG